MPTIDTPELDKQHEFIASGQAETVQDFLDWLSENGLHISHYEARRQTLLGPVEELVIDGRQPEQIMTDFFGIDRNKIESERRAILESLR